MTLPHVEAADSCRKLDQACELLYQSHQLCLVRFACQRGCDEHEAWDAVQELFLRIFRIGMLEPLCAKPLEWQRAWLLRTLNWIVLNKWRHKNAMRRGDASLTVSIDTLLEQGRELPGPRSPEAEHDHAWIRSVIERGVNRLRSSVGDLQWQRIEPSLFGTEYAEVVPDYTPALRVAVHRARNRLRNMIATEAGLGAGSEQGKAVLFQTLAAHN
ncbi:MAG: hypothetical protein B7Z37_01210 [Verrucomicrobia bacterium 12-59-8]|nr:MAG: hypothetical protein B7Z37_01210 [Verrucomicrobia bacterium 12-59-8]